MDLRRRDLLVGAAGIGLSCLGCPGVMTQGDEASDYGWHPLTRSLLARAGEVGLRLNRARVERAVRERAEARGAARLVIKWAESPDHAFDLLSGLDRAEFERAPDAGLWRDPWPRAGESEATAERAFDLYWLAADALRVRERDRQLTAPKLAAKRAAAGLGAAAAFEVRARAARIGWLETSLPAAAAESVRAVEALLCDGHSERSGAVRRQVLAFEACEHGLLATWETPSGLVCAPFGAAA